MPFSCCCCCCHIQYFSSYFFLSLSPLYVSLSATGFLCVFSTYFPFLNITNFLFPLQSSLTLLAATTNVSTTASLSVSLYVSVSGYLANDYPYLYLQLYVYPMLFWLKKVWKLFVSQSVNGKICIDLCLCFIFLPTFLGHANRHSDASDSVGSFG